MAFFNTSSLDSYVIRLYIRIELNIKPPYTMDIKIELTPLTTEQKRAEFVSDLNRMMKHRIHLAERAAINKVKGDEEAVNASKARKAETIAHHNMRSKKHLELSWYSHKKGEALQAKIDQAILTLAQDTDAFPEI